jgi:hypothetical protein
MTEIATLKVDRASLGDLRGAARSANSNVIWILAADATPQDGALAALEEVGVRPAASLPVSAAGAPIEAITRRQVPLRHTRLISLLVDRAHVVELEPPDPRRFGAYAENEWTSRLLARHPGVLVPASRVTASAPGRASVAATLRMAQASVWTRGEKIAALRGLVSRYSAGP